MIEPGTIEHELAVRLEGAAPPTSTPVMREALGQSVTRRPLAHLLDSENTVVRRTTIVEAVAQDAAFFVDVPGHILALDIDGEGGDDPIRTAHQVHVRLLRMGYRPVMLESGRAGHRHIFCRVPAAARAGIVGRLRLPPGQVRRDTIRPPLTLHRSGKTRSRLLAPLSPELALARLDGALTPRPVHANTSWLLSRDSDPRLEGRSVSERMHSIAMGVANAGWTEEEFAMAVTSSSVPASRLLDRRIGTRGTTQTLDWLSTVWADAARTVQESPPVSPGTPPRELVAALSWALSRPWPGRSGATDFSVFLGLLSGWARCGHNSFNMSEREICEAAGISGRDAVRNALRRLVADGVIRRTETATADPHWRLRTSPTYTVQVDGDVDTDLAASVGRVIAINAHDAFRNKLGLGKRAGQVYLALFTSTPSSIEELARRTGATTRVTSTILRDMQDHGLVAAVASRWELDAGDLDTCAKALSAAGRREQQRDQHRKQREARDIIADRRNRDRSTSAP